MLYKLTRCFLPTQIAFCFFRTPCYANFMSFEFFLNCWSITWTYFLFWMAYDRCN